MPDRNIIFCSKLPLKLFSATVPNADPESLKSLHTLLGPQAGEIRTKHMVRNVQNFHFLTQKNQVF